MRICVLCHFAENELHFLRRVEFEKKYYFMIHFFISVNIWLILKRNFFPQKQMIKLKLNRNGGMYYSNATIRKSSDII